MGNSKATKRKRNAQTNGLSEKIQKLSPTAPISPPLSVTDGPKNLSTLISNDELEITVDTLRTLAEYPSVIKLKQCRGLRAAVFDFKQACTTGVNSAGKHRCNTLLTTVG
jgi:hypothetical protein